ncbi:hypothetical protein [Streptomyces sp. NPDC056361]|uniref:hypothetical protein n=1 Tax=Streptomyces sp. NPDC056361 TaxID=3345795 RepID=UPI0035DC5144
MSPERMSAAEIVTELRSALIADGWLPSAVGAYGPGPVAEDAEVDDIARALQGHSIAATLRQDCADLLARAAAEATAAYTATGAAEVYTRLGCALAYATQARRALTDTPARGA